MKFHINMVCVLLLALLAGCAAPSAERPGKIKVLVLTGGHSFKHDPFFQMFQSNSEITFTAAPTQVNSAQAYDRADLYGYDVVLLYDSPTEITEAEKARFLGLFDHGIGLVVLHHAYLSYPYWPEFERIAGGKYVYLDGEMTNGITSSTYQGNLDIPVTVVDGNHPVTAGLRNFMIHDELYSNMHMLGNATPLLKTGNEWLAWARLEKKSRVVGMILGHGCYDDPNFQRFIAQSIRWTAKP